MSLFDMNGPLMNALRKLANIFLCNLMFCLCSFPIITIGASLSALYACVQAIMTDDEDDVVIKQFWYEFKRNLKQGTAIWLFCLIIVAFLGLFYMIVSQMSGAMNKIYIIGFFFMCIVFLFGFQYLFPLQARYQNKVKNTIKNAWLLSIAALPWTLLSIVIVVGAIYITFFMDPNGFNMAVFVWGTLGFGVVAYLNSFIFQKAFRMIDPVTLKEKHTAPKEALFTDEEHRTREMMSQESSYSNPDWNRQDYSTLTKKKDEK